jgi:hydrogenase maturation protein HypF
MCRRISAETGLKRVALSGGVFQNRLLLEKTGAALRSEGFEVLTHRQVPCNDGGISLGQVVVANAISQERGT